ncbi:uncharacterized protein G2W53_020629 [Senna tora]|uniref:Uncharacterized protein n=1 Tax=Senna tora TaxID=362788 RepID=A0A834WGG5_9FABA|nr:uncharacterized protein G2W53_020629 [Senna tora]
MNERNTWKLALMISVSGYPALARGEAPYVSAPPPIPPNPILILEVEVDPTPNIPHPRAMMASGRDVVPLFVAVASSIAAFEFLFLSTFISLFSQYCKGF